MSTANFVPQIWSTKILRVLHDNLVAKKICSREAEGKIKRAGDTVHFNGLAKPTINNYAGTVTYENLDDSRITLIIDQQKYFAFKVGDIEKAQANVDLKGSQASEAAYGLQEVADSFILAKYVDAKRTITDNTLDSSTVISVMGTAQQYLAEVNVKQKDMFMVIPPWVQLKLKLAGIQFQINNGINGTGGMAWTDELGFDVFVSNQVPNTGTLNAPVSHCLAGAYNSIVYAEQIIETETLRLENSFDDAVRGLHVYGGKTIRPDHLVHLSLTYAAETTI